MPLVSPLAAPALGAAVDCDGAAEDALFFFFDLNKPLLVLSGTQLCSCDSHMMIT